MERLRHVSADRIDAVGNDQNNGSRCGIRYPLDKLHLSGGPIVIDLAAV